MKIKSLIPDSFWLPPLFTREFSFDLSFCLGEEGAVPANKPLTSVYNLLWCTEETQKRVLPAEGSLGAPLAGFLPLAMRGLQPLLGHRPRP